MQVSLELWAYIWFLLEKYMKIIKLQQNVQNAEYKLPVKEI